MAKHIFNSGTFREAFTMAKKNSTKWFPGHMAKGMQQLQAKLKETDCIIEVHDARIPFSGRNPNFKTHLLLRPHLLVLNKMDLADLSRKREIEAKLHDAGIKNILYTDCKKSNDKALKHKLIPMVTDLIEKSERFHRAEETDYNILIIGIPNVGKSSLINRLRSMHRKTNKGKASKVGAEPGITRSVLERIIVCDSPKINVLDSPGILSPNTEDIETGLKLAVCATLKDHHVGQDIVADYMLFLLNKTKNFRYVDYFSLQRPTDDIFEFLVGIAKQNNYTLKTKNFHGASGGLQVRPDTLRAANLALKAFREGKLGKVMLDSDYFDGKYNER